MGKRAEDSVVDQYGHAWDHENLYIASTGVLPTSSTCNSTMNALAVAMRTAAYIIANNGGPAMLPRSNTLATWKPLVPHWVPAA